MGISSALVTALAYLGQGLDWPDGTGLPRSLPFIEGLLTLCVVGGTRFSVRVAQYYQGRLRPDQQSKRVLIAA